MREQVFLSSLFFFVHLHCKSTQHTVPTEHFYIVKQHIKRIMKRFISLFVLLLCLTAVYAQSKQQQRVAYIIEQMNFDRATLQKVKPTITAFVAALHDNKDKHDAVQDKYAVAEEKGKLTEAQAEELMQSKFKKDAGELEIRRKYYDSLKAIVGAVKARQILALSNDKLSKKK